MSEQENPSVSPVVVVESATSRRSVPFKPTELQDSAAPDLHQKRAPATTAAVPENFKVSTEIADNKDLKGSEHGTSSERHKHVAKKLSSNVSNVKRESTPAIPMTPIVTDTKQSNTTTTAVPASSVVAPIPPAATEKAIEDKAELDSITSDITELRSPETMKKSKEWLDEEEASGLPRSESRTSRTSRVTRAVRELFCCGVQLEAPSEDNVNGTDTLDDNTQEEVEAPVPLQRKLGNEIVKSDAYINTEGSIEPTTSAEFKKKEISWSDETYLDKVQLQDLHVRSATWMLERKASVGPCYRRSMPFGEPSGITICLPHKSSRNINITQNDFAPARSGISITVSKRCINGKLKPYEPFEFEMRTATIESTLKVESDIGIKQDSSSNYCAHLRGKLDSLCGRIKSAFHI